MQAAGDARRLPSPEIDMPDRDGEVLVQPVIMVVQEAARRSEEVRAGLRSLR
jgi:hypothetical protein